MKLNNEKVMELKNKYNCLVILAEGVKNYGEFESNKHLLDFDKEYYVLDDIEFESIIILEADFYKTLSNDDLKLDEINEIRYSSKSDYPIILFKNNVGYGLGTHFWYKSKYGIVIEKIINKRYWKNDIYDNPGILVSFLDKLLEISEEFNKKIEDLIVVDWKESINLEKRIDNFYYEYLITDTEIVEEYTYKGDPDKYTRKYTIY